MTGAKYAVRESFPRPQGGGHEWVHVAWFVSYEDAMAFMQYARDDGRSVELDRA